MDVPRNACCEIKGFPPRLEVSSHPSSLRPCSPLGGQVLLISHVLRSSVVCYEIWILASLCGTSTGRETTLPAFYRVIIHNLLGSWRTAHWQHNISKNYEYFIW